MVVLVAATYCVDVGQSSVVYDLGELSGIYIAGHIDGYYDVHACTHADAARTRGQGVHVVHGNDRL